ncbi:hypothetical protein SH528x_003600 [Novipirellula sp. SH528]|uniref:hypothetical protein n=1 Tax=Novipirellula sp. SH528 TaxID=3454466 RepID=UPI003F9FC643
MTTKKIEALIPDLWLQTVEPWDSAALKEFWGCFAGRIPADVAAFYSLTDGGEIPELECRFYGLEEAIEIAEHIKGLRTEIPLIPFFEASGEASDPICVILEPGLAGTVVQFCHDRDSRVHAISFYDFLLKIAEFDDGYLVASDHTFCFPKKLTQKEKKIADKLVERSRMQVDDDSECINAEYEPELFAQLAQSMPIANKSKLLDPFTYNNGKARRDAALKLYYKDTPESKAKLAEYCKIMTDFARELEKALAKEGVEIALSENFGVVQTCFVCYRNRKVLVDDVYSTEQGNKRWDRMRKWIEEMDKLLEAYSD